VIARPLRQKALILDRNRPIGWPRFNYRDVTADSEQSYLRDVQYRFPDRLKAGSILHTRTVGVTGDNGAVE
jgi:hypothetical protein